MSLFELSMSIVCFSQPIIIGLVAFIGTMNCLQSSAMFSVNLANRARLGTFRFYECATFSRSTALFRYGIAFTSILCAYLVYDIDLLFLL